ncbi:MAG TPA: SDR family NAD(P)-dependent oxidoreductase, partial [Cytophagales bacterium]|nr:SDR family NAD(P)-dependent oxidoreductase [Cytophagales bacterium]
MSSNIALVSGGTSGVGLSIVRALAKQKYDVYFIGTDRQKGEAIALELRRDFGPNHSFIEQDLSNLAGVQ